jgi:hypothetical protein
MPLLLGRRIAVPVPVDVDHMRHRMRSRVLRDDRAFECGELRTRSGSTHPAFVARTADRRDEGRS